MSGTRSWAVTTHDWSVEVDAVHLAGARRCAESLGAGLPTHLVLEVLAYADDEAEALGRRGQVSVDLRDSEIVVADDGRGTDTRRDEHGRVVRKPVMATKDVRFFDADGQPVPSDLDDRTIGITLEELRAVPRVVGIAGGAEKVDAIRAALRGRLVDVLITDAGTAEALVAD